MCVIAYYPAGLTPNYDELENCFCSNSDGAGLMYWDQKKAGVIIDKGYMTYATFRKAVENLPIDVDRVFHFRIATSGKISKECCHPFPVTNDLDRMRSTKVHTNVGLAHNGVISWCTPQEGMKSPYSDSMIFVKDIIWECEHGNGVFNQGIKTLINKAAPTSKFAIMRDNETILIGDFQQGTSGAFYSNDSWSDYNYYKYGYLYSGEYSCGDEDTYRVFFAMDNPSDDIAQILNEDLDEQGCGVYEYTVKRKGIEFVTWGLPMNGDVMGCKWTVTKYNPPKAKGYKKLMRSLL